MDELHRDHPEDFKQKTKIKLFFVADHIRSGHNIGSLFRIADAFGMSGVLICGYKIDLQHPEVKKTALGAQNTVGWKYFKDPMECIEYLKIEKIKIIGVEQTNQSQTLDALVIDSEESYALILGNEIDGISEEILEKIDLFVEIPQYGTKHSLNVSVAAGIVAWEFMKKMKY